MTRAEQIAAKANTTVSTWPALSRVPGDVIKCQSGGFLVEVGEAFPIWRTDMAGVRQLLLDRDLRVAALGQGATEAAT